ncbi:hypothetical protein HAX54_005422, partial [Datura stramonium]|nr:hypothetical protein [Datura stramonium]
MGTCVFDRGLPIWNHVPPTNRRYNTDYLSTGCPNGDPSAECRPYWKTTSLSTVVKQPLLGTRVTLAVHGSEPLTHHLVGSRIFVCSVYCFAS